LRCEEAARVIARAKITLNVLRRQNLPDGTNMRSFEVPGCGGFVLADRTAGAAGIFPEGEAGAYFATQEELCDQIDRYLSDDAAREEIVRRAHAIVADNHQYAHRAREVIERCLTGR
jgi:spore maturation protein CgeB